MTVSLEEFLRVARKDNPDVTEQRLIDYWLDEHSDRYTESVKASSDPPTRRSWMAIANRNNPDASQLDLLRYYRDTYEVAKPVIPETPEPKEPEEEQGNFMRGWTNTLPRLKQEYAQNVILGGAALEDTRLGGLSESMIEHGLDVRKDAKAEFKSKPTDSPSYAWEQGADVFLTEYLPYLAGETAGNVAEAGVEFGLGTLIGTLATGNPVTGTAAGLTSMLAGMGGKKAGLAALKAATEEFGEEAVKRYLKRQMGKKVGGYTAMAGGAAMSGFGETGGAILDDLEERGLSPQDANLERWLGTGLFHTGTELFLDKLGLDAFTKPLANMTGKGITGAAKAIAGRGLATGLKETPVEVIQTGTERFAGNKSLTDDEALRGYIDSAVGGFFGGGMTGVGGGTVQGALGGLRPNEPPSPTTGHQTGQRDTNEDIQAGIDAAPDIESAKKAALESLSKNLEAASGEADATIGQGQSVQAELQKFNQYSKWLDGLTDGELTQALQDAQDLTDSIDAQRRGEAEGPVLADAYPEDSGLDIPTIQVDSEVTPGPEFYSRLDMALASVKQESMPAQQWLAWLGSNAQKYGFKREEVQSRGLDEYLGTKQGKVTKDDITKYLDDNRINVTSEVDDSSKQTTQYGRLYSEPGAENHRTIKLKIDDNGDFVYPDHWDNEKDIILHMRVTDRVDENGRRILHVEEFQSDKARLRRQAKGGQDVEAVAEAKANLSRAETEVEVAKKRFEDRFQTGIAIGPEEMSKFSRSVNGALARAAEAREEYENIRTKPVNSRLDPYTSDTNRFTQLGVRKLLRYAAENGYDGVTFSTAATQNKRWDQTHNATGVMIEEDLASRQPVVYWNTPRNGGWTEIDDKDSLARLKGRLSPEEYQYLMEQYESSGDQIQVDGSWLPGMRVRMIGDARQGYWKLDPTEGISEFRPEAMRDMSDEQRDKFDTYQIYEAARDAARDIGIYKTDDGKFSVESFFKGVNKKFATLADAKEYLFEKWMEEAVPRIQGLVSRKAATLSFESREVGGEWAKNYYDKMIPDVAKKSAKPHGATVSNVPLKGIGTKKGVLITDKARQSLLEKGNPILTDKSEAETKPNRTVSGQKSATQKPQNGVERGAKRMPGKAEVQWSDTQPDDDITGWVRDTAKKIHESIAGRVRLLTDAEAQVVEQAIQTLRDAGIDLPDLSNVVDNWYAMTGDFANKAGAYFHGKSRSIGFNPEVLRGAIAGDQMARDLMVQYLAHEFTHDQDVQDGFIEDAESAQSERMTLKITSISTEGEIVVDDMGDVMDEVMAEWDSNANGLSAFLGYPLDSLATILANGITPRLIAQIKTEVFAQLGALYMTRPQKMKKALPNAYAMMQEVYGGKSVQSTTGQARTDQGNNRVRQALQGSSANKRSRIVHAARNKGSTRERQAHRTVREAQQGVSSGRRSSHKQSGREELTPAEQRNRTTIADLFRLIPESIRVVRKSLSGEKRTHKSGADYKNAGITEKTKFLSRLPLKAGSIARVWAKSIAESRDRARDTIEALSTREKLPLKLLDESFWNRALTLQNRARYWYEISAEIFEEVFPDLSDHERRLFIAVVAATSPVANPYQNLARAVGAFSQYLRGVPIDVDLVITKNVAEALTTGDLEGLKTGSFGGTMQYILGLTDTVPLSTNDRQVAGMFGIEGDDIAKNSEMYEPISRFFINLRDELNANLPPDADPFETWQLQAMGWVQIRYDDDARKVEEKIADAEEKGKPLSEEEIQQLRNLRDFDDYKQAFEREDHRMTYKGVFQLLREGGIETKSGKITRDILLNEGTAASLSPTMGPFLRGNISTTAIGTTLDPERDEIQQLSELAKQHHPEAFRAWISLFTNHLKSLRSADPFLSIAKAVKGIYGDGKLGTKTSRVQTPDAGEPYAFGGTHGKVFEPNIRIPYPEWMDARGRVFSNALVGKAFKQAGMGSASYAPVDMGSAPAVGARRSYGIFVETKANEIGKTDRAILSLHEQLKDLSGAFLTVRKVPNGYVFAVGPGKDEVDIQSVAKAAKAVFEDGDYDTESVNVFAIDFSSTAGHDWVDHREGDTDASVSLYQEIIDNFYESVVQVYADQIMEKVDAIKKWAGRKPSRAQAVQFLRKLQTKPKDAWKHQIAQLKGVSAIGGDFLRRWNHAVEAERKLAKAAENFSVAQMKWRGEHEGNIRKKMGEDPMMADAPDLSGYDKQTPGMTVDEVRTAALRFLGKSKLDAHEKAGLTFVKTANAIPAAVRQRLGLAAWVIGNPTNPSSAITPELSIYEGSKTGNIGFIPSGIPGTLPLPIRVVVGEATGEHQGYGARHMLHNALTSPKRRPPEKTGNLLEDLLRQAASILRRKRVELYRNPSKPGSVIVTTGPSELGVVLTKEKGYYSVTTVAPPTKATWDGMPVWRGQLDKIEETAESKLVKQGDALFEVGEDGVFLRGVHDPETGKTYIVSGNLRPDDVEAVISHELLHARITSEAEGRTRFRVVTGTAFKSILSRLEMLEKAGDQQTKKVLAGIRKHINDVGVPEDAREEEFLTHTLAFYTKAEKYVPKSIKAWAESTIRSIKVGLARIAVRAGLNPDFVMKQLDIMDIVKLLRDEATARPENSQINVDGKTAEVPWPRKSNRSLGSLFKRNADDLADPHPYPEQEQKWLENRLVMSGRNLTIGQKLKQRYDDIKGKFDGLVRQYKYLDPKNPYLARAMNIIRIHKAGLDHAGTKALDSMLKITGHLKSVAEYNLFEEIIYLRDLSHDASLGKALPDEWDAHKIAHRLGQLEAAVNRNPNVFHALQERERNLKEVQAQLVKYGIVSQEDIDDNPSYFRHIVLQYAMTKTNKSIAGDAAIKTVKASYARHRKGTELSINTNWLEVEYTFLRAAHRDIATAQAVTAMRLQYDRMDEFKEWRKTAGVAYQGSANDNKALRKFQELNPEFEAYQFHQFDKGNVYYSGPGMTDAAYDKLVDLTGKALLGVQGLSPQDVQDIVDQIKPHLMVGGKKRVSLMPTAIIQQMELANQMTIDDDWWSVVEGMQKAWKGYILMNPRSIVTYTINNTVGDLDAMVAGAAPAMAYLPRAFRELYNVATGKSAASANYLRALALGVFDAGWSISELGEINKDPQFRKLTGDNPNIVSKGVRGYWNAARKFTVFRESIARYAVYLYALEQYENEKRKGTPHNEVVKAVHKRIGYGSTYKPVMDGMANSSLSEVAALVSRETIGDYGAISAWGENLRSRLLPFWSFLEINFRRYSRIFKNVGQHMAANPGKAIPLAALHVMKIALVYTTIRVANYAIATAGGDEDGEDLPMEDPLRLHLNLGRNEDGTYNWMRMQGSLSDFIAWFGLGDAFKTMSEMESGMVGWSDVLADVAAGPVKKLGSALSPFAKGAYEYSSDTSLFPDPTDPRIITDMGKHLASILKLQNEYVAILGKPSRGYWKSWVNAMGISRVDPDEQYYWAWKSIAARFNDLIGNEGDSSFSTERSRALRNWKLAKRYGDTEAEAKYLKILESIPGTDASSINRSIMGAHPLGSVQSIENRNKLFNMLTPEEKRIFDRAEKYWVKMYQ